MPSIKNMLADTFASNHKVNKKALLIKKSLDEVSKMIHADKSQKKGKK